MLRSLWFFLTLPFRFVVWPLWKLYFYAFPPARPCGPTLGGAPPEFPLRQLIPIEVLRLIPFLIGPAVIAGFSGLADVVGLEPLDDYRMMLAMDDYRTAMYHLWWIYLVGSLVLCYIGRWVRERTIKDREQAQWWWKNFTIPWIFRPVAGAVLWFVPRMLFWELDPDIQGTLLGVGHFLWNGLLFLLAFLWHIVS